MKKNILSIMVSCFAFFANSQTNTNAILLDGTSNYIEILDNPVLNPTSAITVEAWIKANSWGVNLFDNTIVGKDSWATSSSGYVLRVGANGSVSFNFAVSGGLWVEAVSPSVMLTNVWNHIAGTFDGTKINVYINGVLAASQNYSGAIVSSTENINIGTCPFSPRFFDGSIDQVEIWNVALDTAKIHKYMKCSPIGNEVGLVGFWNLEEGTGTFTADITSNGNHGALFNGASWSTNTQAICYGVGLEEYNNTILQIFPNPSAGKISIESKSSFNAIEIYNFIGEKVYTELNFKKETLKVVDLCKLEKGIYFVKILSDRFIPVKKIIIE